MHDEKADQHFPPSDVQNEDRDDNPNQGVNYFSSDKYGPLPGCIDLFAKIETLAHVVPHLAVVFAQHPVDSEQAIKENTVVVLVFMETFPLVFLVQPDEAIGLDVIVVLINIGVGMVQDVVLYLPVIDVACQEVDGTAHQVVHPLAAGKGAVVAVVHYAHADERSRSADHNGQQQHHPLVEIVGQDKKIRRQQHGKHNGRFEIQLPVAVSLDVVLLKIGVHPAVQGTKEVSMICLGKFKRRISHFKKFLAPLSQKPFNNDDKTFQN